jgi:hypothetical protein
MAKSSMQTRERKEFFLLKKLKLQSVILILKNGDKLIQLANLIRPIDYL